MYVVKCALVLVAAVAVSGYNLNFADVEFHLFTRANPTVSQPIFPSVDSFLSSNFLPSRRTILTIHSNGESVSGNFNAFVVAGHLAAEDVNVIAVDWSKASFLYSVGLANAPQAGELIAEIINVLVVNFSYNTNLVRIVGVGLGGHIAGITARHITGKVPHIVGKTAVYLFFLLAAEDVNVIAVDWSKASFLCSVGLANAPQAGELIAEIINVLVVNFSYNTNLVHIVGVGLGGHIAGITARHITRKVPHIVALDPSFHGWTHHPDLLSTEDAGFVEVLHTTSGLQGYDKPIGHIDFYPNGGTYQNGCATDTSCSHIYSYAFYAESLSAETNDGNKFVGTACDSYEDAIARKCDGEKDAIFGGTPVKSEESGIYYFNTNFVQPFAQG